MPEHEAPYDPYIPSGQAAGSQQQGGSGGNARTQALQAVGLAWPLCAMAAVIARGCERATSRRIHGRQPQPPDLTSPHPPRAPAAAAANGALGLWAAAEAAHGWAASFDGAVGGWGRRLDNARWGIA